MTLTDCYAVTGAAPKAFVLSDDPNRPATNLGTVSVGAKTALQGDAATTTLTNFHFNEDWDTVTDDYPLPKTIADILAGNVLEQPVIETSATTTKTTVTTTTASTTTATTATTIAAEDSTAAVTTSTDKKGCGSSALSYTVVLITALCSVTALFVSKNKKRRES